MSHPVRLTRALVLAGALALVPASAAQAAVGDISTVAGTGTQGLSGDGGPAVSAQLRFPIGARLTTKLRRANGDSGGHSNVTLAPRHKELPPRLATLVAAELGDDLVEAAFGDALPG